MMHAKIYTGDTTGILHKITDPDSGKCLYPDMLLAHAFPELAITDHTIYEEANALMQEYGTSHCLFFLTRAEDTNLVQEYIDSLSAKETSPLLSDEERNAIDAMASKLLLSHTMTLSFLQLMTYYKEIGGCIEDLFTPFYTEYALPVKTKNEGKMLYEHIKNTILG